MSRTPLPVTVEHAGPHFILRASDGTLVSHVARVNDQEVCPEHGGAKAWAYHLAEACNSHDALTAQVATLTAENDALRMAGIDPSARAQAATLREALRALVLAIDPVDSRNKTFRRDIESYFVEPLRQARAALALGKGDV